MPSYKDQLTEEQVLQLIAYIKTLRQNARVTPTAGNTGPGASAQQADRAKQPLPGASGSAAQGPLTAVPGAKPTGLAPVAPPVETTIVPTGGGKVPLHAGR